MDHTTLIEYGFYAGLGASWAITLTFATAKLALWFARGVHWRIKEQKRRAKK